jgi:hypothetical protein
MFATRLGQALRRAQWRWGREMYLDTVFGPA